MKNQRKITVVSLVLLTFIMFSRCDSGPAPTEATSPATQSGQQGKIDITLGAFLARQVTTDNVHKAFPAQLINAYAGWHNAKWQVLVDVFIQGNAKAIPELAKIGVHVRSITRSGIMTATVPLDKIEEIAEIADVSRIEAGKRLRKYNDVSRTADGLNVPGVYPGDAPTGAGVVVGVVDTGIDWSHADFRNADGSTRIHAVWDHSDYTDGNTPDAVKNYGYVYDQAVIQDCIDGAGAYCVQKDSDGHGTHVAGTAAGSGRAFGYGSAQYQFAGAAPEATLVIVQYDFDGERNADTYIIDAIDWIFMKASELGMPAVINLSLGSDFGPHDGSTLEERGIDDLTGAGHIVVAAAGNPGTTGDDTWGNLSLWGYPMHGESVIPPGGYSTITLEIPEGYASNPDDDDYVFFLAWYGGNDKTQIQVKTPGGSLYPPNFSGRNKRTWLTGTSAAYYATSEGTIYIGNGGDLLGWGTDNGDNELYIEISDWNNTNEAASGTWEIRIYDRGLSEGGAYHSWHGASRSLTTARPIYDGNPTDNWMTVGSPASANNVIAMGAYTTRMGWEYKDLNASDGDCLEGAPCCQIYNDYPGGTLSYYDPYFTDENGDTFFNYDFSFGHACYFEPGLGDTAEPYYELAFFSALGPTRDGRTKPAVATPGVGIISSLSQDALDVELAMAPEDTYFIRTNRVFADGQHAVLQGTSMACPNGTGSVAVLLAADPTMTPADVRSVLQNTARSDVYTGAVPNNAWGYGKVDVEAALSSLVCMDDADCDDGNDCTADTCTDGSCGNAPLADDTACGGGICCDASCDVAFCDVDADCDDGDECTTDTCLNASSCAASCQNDPIPDCGPSAMCGDGVCAGYLEGEDCISCPSDCTCKGRNCSKGCCGDGACNGLETAKSCAIDCA